MKFNIPHVPGFTSNCLDSASYVMIKITRVIKNFIGFDAKVRVLTKHSKNYITCDVPFYMYIFSDHYITDRTNMFL